MVLWFVPYESTRGTQKQFDFADCYLEELQVARRLARNTIASYARDIRKLEQFTKLKQKNIAELYLVDSTKTSSLLQLSGLS